MRKLDNKTIIELRKMMKNGNSQYDVAKTLNIGKTSIQRYAKDIIKVNDIKDKEEKIIIRRLYNDGFNSSTGIFIILPTPCLIYFPVFLCLYVSPINFVESICPSLII